MAEKSVSVFLLTKDLNGLTNANLQVNAARDLKNYRDQESVDALANALKNAKSDAVRAEAARSLGELKARDALDMLLHALQSDASPAVAACAAEALGKIGDDRAIAPLIETLGYKKDPAPRLQAAAALARFGLSAEKQLIAALGDKQKRSAALLALRRAGDSDALPPLLKIFSDEGLPALDRKNAADIIGNLGSGVDSRVFLSALKKADRLYFIESIIRVLNDYATVGQFASIASNARLRGYKDLSGNLRKLRKGLAADLVLDWFGEPDSVQSLPDFFVVKENWVYQRNYGQFQIVVRNGVIGEPVNAEAVINRLNDFIKDKNNMG